ncbi:MAG: tripartite tricarboxylate transporter substrate binding protein [Proteobacteria bacterium]|nr:tripartite tricarboxylate transporter substrate binding protein [Pseudomonadota bacterium]
MPCSRRSVPFLLAGLLLGAVTAEAADGFPTPGKPIRIIVPFTAGGQAETMARIVGTRLADVLGVPVIVETKPGASTALGASEVQRAAPDGHTLLFTNGLTHAQNPHLRAKLAYDPRKFTPIFQLVESGNVLIANHSLPVGNVRELVAFAKANPGKISYASIGAGSGAHLLAELFMQKTGTALTHIPYKGSADANRDLWGGQVDVMFDGFGTAIQGLNAKRVKALGIATKTRNPALPDVPTLAEQGVDGVDLQGYIGFFGPADMPPAVVTRLNAEMQKILDTPAVTEQILQGGNTPAGGSAAKFAKVVAEQYDTWGGVIQKIGLKLE